VYIRGNRKKIFTFKHKSEHVKVIFCKKFGLHCGHRRYQQINDRRVYSEDSNVKQRLLTSFSALGKRSSLTLISEIFFTRKRILFRN